MKFMCNTEYCLIHGRNAKCQLPVWQESQGVQGSHGPSPFAKSVSPSLLVADKKNVIFKIHLACSKVTFQCPDGYQKVEFKRGFCLLLWEICFLAILGLSPLFS